MPHLPLLRPLLVAAALVSGTVAVATAPSIAATTPPSSPVDSPSTPVPAPTPVEYPTTPYPTTPYPTSNVHFLDIEDGASLGPGDPLPDSISAFDVYTAPGYAVPSVYRDGALVASGRGSTVRLADLRSGDLIVVTHLAFPGLELFRFTYQRSLHLEPVCPGATVLAGTRTAGSTGLYGSSALWVPTTYPTEPTYPTSGYPDGDYPGGGPGFTPTNGEIAAVSAVGPSGVRFDARRPVTLGMQLLLSEYFTTPGGVNVYQRVEQNVGACDPDPTPTPAPEATPAPGATPAPAATPAPSPVQAPAPPKDTAPPKAALSKLTARLLAKLGRSTLIKSGLPLTLTVDEPGTLGGSITLIDGRKKTKFDVKTPVQAGKQTLRLKFSKAVKKRLKKASKRAKLKVALTLTDQAGNTAKLPAATVRLP